MAVGAPPGSPPVPPSEFPQFRLSVSSDPPSHRDYSYRRGEISSLETLSQRPEENGSGGGRKPVRGLGGSMHRITDLAHMLHFYERWAPDYDKDVASLQYRAPRLAVDCLSQAFPGPPHASLILDVACGTGLVAVELQAWGFLQLHGVDGSPEMLKQAQARGLYQRLSLCTLGQEPLPSPEGTYDEVLVWVPSVTARCPTVQFLNFCGLVCLSTRANPSNLRYKEALEVTLDRLEQAKQWERLVAWAVDRWELATSKLEEVPGTSDTDGQPHPWHCLLVPKAGGDPG